MSFRPIIAFAAVLAAGAAFAQSGSPGAPAAASTVSVATASSVASTASTAPVGTSSVAAAASAAAPALASTAVKPGDAKAGQGKAAVCGACHGMDGNSTDPQYPRLAGQNAHYIVLQLTHFKSGARANAIMAGMAASLSPQDMADVAAYFSEQEVQAGVADDTLVGPGGKLYREGDVARKIPACMSCHGPDGAGNPGAPYPHLAGQHADYLQTVLTAWHDGDAWGKDEHAEIMPTIAKRLDKQDIAALASYIEGLHTAEPAKTSTP